MIQGEPFCNMQPGDGRLNAAAEYLAGQGYSLVSEREARQARFLLVGQPFTDWQPVFSTPPSPGTLIFAGRVSAEARRQAAAQDCPVVDYMQDETLLWQNAVLTAEGALGLLLAAKPTVLWGSGLVLTGYGRVAQCLARRLAGLGVRVTVAARRGETRAQAGADGFAAATLADLADAAPLPEYFVNTVPAPVLTQQLLEALPTGAYLLDLAAAPGGVALPRESREAVCRQRGISYVTAPGLPGRVAPVTAGQLIGRTVLCFLRQHPQAALPNLTRRGED